MSASDHSLHTECTDPDHTCSRVAPAAIDRYRLIRRIAHGVRLFLAFTRQGDRTSTARPHTVAGASMADLSRLLKESWTLVEEQQDRVAGYFYARMFLSHPHLRSLFPVQMDVQRARLLGAIVTAVQTMDDPDRFDEYLRSLGRDHRKFQVEPEHYDVVREALLEAMRTFGGEQWDIAYEQAWGDAYNLIARRMMAGAAEDAGPAYWYAEALSHERRSRDIAVLTCRPLQHPFEYRAGQYVSVEAPRHQPRLWRAYS